MLGYGGPGCGGPCCGRPSGGPGGGGGLGCGSLKTGAISVGGGSGICSSGAYPPKASVASPATCVRIVVEGGTNDWPGTNSCV